MKLRARFPQIGQEASDGPTRSARGALRRAFWPTTSRTMPESGDEPVEAVEPMPALPAAVPPAVRVQLASNDWASTVAAWRSTTGLSDDKK